MPKIAFLGEAQLDHPEVSTFQAVAEKFRQLSFSDWLQSRKDASLTMLGGRFDPTHLMEYPSHEMFNRLGYDRSSGFWALMRSWRFLNYLYVLPSLGVILCSLLLCAVSKNSACPTASRTRLLKTRNSLLWIALLGMLIWIIALWRPHLVITVPYVSLLSLGLSAAISLWLCDAWTRTLVAMAHCTIFVLIWIIQPWIAFGNVNPATFAMAFLGWLVLFWRSIRGIAGVTMLSDKDCRSLGLKSC